VLYLRWRSTLSEEDFQPLIDRLCVRGLQSVCAFFKVSGWGCGQTENGKSIRVVHRECQHGLTVCAEVCHLESIVGR